MVSKYDLKEYIKKNADKIPYMYNEEDDAIYYKDGTYISSLDTFLDVYRKHSGESFESIYYEHAFLQDVRESLNLTIICISTTAPNR